MKICCSKTVFNMSRYIIKHSTNKKWKSSWPNSKSLFLSSVQFIPYRLGHMFHFRQLLSNQRFQLDPTYIKKILNKKYAQFNCRVPSEHAWNIYGILRTIWQFFFSTAIALSFCLRLKTKVKKNMKKNMGVKSPHLRFSLGVAQFKLCCYIIIVVAVTYRYIKH